jgi:hypothetical protein
VLANQTMRLVAQRSVNLHTYADITSFRNYRGSNLRTPGQDALDVMARPQRALLRGICHVIVGIAQKWVSRRKPTRLSPNEVKLDQLEHRLSAGSHALSSTTQRYSSRIRPILPARIRKAYLQAKYGPSPTILPRYLRATREAGFRRLMAPTKLRYSSRTLRQPPGNFHRERRCGWSQHLSTHRSE